MKQKFGKKLFSLLICFAMIFSQMSVSFADTVTALSEDGKRFSEVWDMENNQWLNSGDSLSTYWIGLAEDWKAFADCVNAGNTLSGKTVKLISDIWFDSEYGQDYSLTPVGSLAASGTSSPTLTVKDCHPFSGTFDGQNFMLSGVKMDDSIDAGLKDLYSIGLFGYVKDAVIKNLVVQGNITVTSYKGAAVNYYGGVGAVAGDAAGKTTLENVINYCAVDTSAATGNYVTASGMVGKAYSDANTHQLNLINCMNEADIKSSKYASGLVAHQPINNNVSVINGIMKGCVNRGMISGSTASALAHQGKNFQGGISASCNTYPGVKLIYSIPNGASYIDDESLVTTNTSDTYGVKVAAADIDSWKTAWILNNSTNGVVFTMGDYGLEWVGETSPEIFRVEVMPYDGASEVTAEVILAGESTPLQQIGTDYYVTSGTQMTVKLMGVYPVYTVKTAANGDHGFGSNVYYGNNSQTEVEIPVYVNGKNIRIQYGTEAEYAAATDFTWYNDSAQSYEIKTAGQLKGFRDLVNSGVDFKDKTVKLSDDIDAVIDVTDETCWTPIGAASGTPFKGTFDGNGKEIVYKIDSSRTTTYGALFGYIEDAAVKNLTVSGENKQAANYAAGIVADADSSRIENCINQVTVNLGTSNSYAAGIVCNADNGSEIVNCANEGTITAKTYAAGVVYKAAASTIRSCTNLGTVTTGTSTNYAAGIVCNITGASLVEGCVNGSASDDNAGAVTSAQYASGIVGTSTGNKSSAFTRIKDCVNYGTIVAIKGYSSGIVWTYSIGDVIAEPQITDCENSGDIKVGTASNTNPTGGIAAKFDGYMKGCINHGAVYSSVNGNAPAGGIVGYLNGKKATAGLVRLENCKNTGYVKAKYAGGIAGQNYVSGANLKTEILNCKNTGKIEGVTYTGGIIGVNSFNKSNASEAAVTSCISCPADGSFIAAVGGDLNYSSGTHTKDYNKIYYLAESAGDAGTEPVAVTADGFRNSTIVKALNNASGTEFWGYNRDAAEGTCPVVFDGFAEYPVLEIKFVPFAESDETGCDISLKIAGEDCTLVTEDGYKYFDIQLGDTGCFSITGADGSSVKYMVKIGENLSELAEANNIPFTVSNANITVYYGTEASYQNFVYDAWYSDEKDEFVIETPGQFMAFANLVNDRSCSFDGKIVKLGSDIDMSGLCSETGDSWIPIGASTVFKGTFDGDGKTLSGIYIDTQKLPSGITAAGIFGTAGGAVFKNLKIASSTITDSNKDAVSVLDAAGMLVGMSKNGSLTIDNVIVEDSVSIEAAGYAVGGIVGFVQTSNSLTITPVQYAKIIKSANKGNVTLLAGAGNTKLGDNTSRTAVGGIIGFIQGGKPSFADTDGRMEYCSNSGKVVNQSSEGTENVAGGLVGVSYAPKMNGTVSGVNVLPSAYLPVKLCYNTGDVSAVIDADTGYAAGIIGQRFGYHAALGYQMNESTISNCYSSGTVSGKNCGAVSNYKGTVADPGTSCYVDNFGETPVFDGKCTTVKRVSVVDIASGALAYILDEGDKSAGRLFAVTQNTVSMIPDFIAVVFGNPVYKITVNVNGIPVNPEAPELAPVPVKTNAFAETLSEMSVGYDAVCLEQYVSKGRSEEMQLKLNVTAPEGYMLGAVSGAGLKEESLFIKDTQITDLDTGDVKVESTVNLTIAAGRDLELNLQYIQIPENYGQAMNIILDGNAGEELTWILNDSSKAADITVGFTIGHRLTEAKLEEKIAELAATAEPRRSGYKFIQWYTDAECQTPFVFNQVLTAYDAAENPLHLYAGWEEIDTVLLNLYSNGSIEAPALFAEEIYIGTETADRTAYMLETEKGTAVSELNNYIPVREGYTFAGWFYDAETHVPYTAETLTEGADLYAGWLAENECFITFDADGGYYTVAGVKADKYMVKVQKAEEPTEEPETEVPIETPAEEPTGELEAEAPAAIFIADLAIPTPNRDMEAGMGFTFEGWTAIAGGADLIAEIPVPFGNTTIYAKWSVMEDVADGPSSFEQFMDSQKKPDGTFNSVIINDYETLKAFAAYVNAGNTCEGMTFTLGDNITLESDWAGIGSVGQPFAGTFNGNGNTITYNRANNSLFNGVSGTVSDVKVNGTGNVTGGIAAQLLGGAAIENCTVLAGTTFNSSGTLGGIAGNADKTSAGITITGCKVEDGVTLNGGNFTGGILGSALTGSGDKTAEALKITDCSVGKAEITGGGSGTELGAASGWGGLGGIMGYGSAYIEGADVDATLKASGGEAYAIGGIVGTQTETAGALVIKQCGFTGTIDVNSGGQIGGILGVKMGRYDTTLEDVYSTGTIKVFEEKTSADKSGIGGILGTNFDFGSVTIENAYWNGTADVTMGSFSEICSGNLSSTVTVGNSYYYHDEDGDPSSSLGTAKGEGFFTSGEATHTLNGDRTDGPWKQGAGVPDFEGKTVHKVTLDQSQITWPNDERPTNITISSKDYTSEDGSVQMTGGTGTSIYVIDGEKIDVTVDYIPGPTTDPETGKTTTHSVTVKFENSEVTYTFTSAGTQSSSSVNMNMSAGSTSESQIQGDGEGTGGGDDNGYGDGTGDGYGDGTGDGAGDGTGEGTGEGEGTGTEGEGTEGEGTGGEGTGTEGEEPGTGDAESDGESQSQPSAPAVTPVDKPQPQPEVQPLPEVQPEAQPDIQPEPQPEVQTPAEEPDDSNEGQDLSEMGSQGSQSGGGDQGEIKPESQIYKIIKKVTNTVKENPAATAAILAGIVAIVAFGAWNRKRKEEK